jgi:hypothetical protein
MPSAILSYNPSTREIVWNGVAFPPRAVERAILRTFGADHLVAKYELRSARKARNGEVVRKFAWSSVFEDMIRDQSIIPILEKLQSE